MSVWLRVALLPLLFSTAALHAAPSAVDYLHRAQVALAGNAIEAAEEAVEAASVAEEAVASEVAEVEVSAEAEEVEVAHPEEEEVAPLPSREPDKCCEQNCPNNNK